MDRERWLILKKVKLRGVKTEMSPKKHRQRWAWKIWCSRQTSYGYQEQVAVVRALAYHQCCPGWIPAQGPVSRKPQKLFPQSQSTISNLTIITLLQSCFNHTNMKSGYLHTRSFRRIHFSIFRHRWTKNGFTGPKRLQGPWAVFKLNLLLVLDLLQSFSVGSRAFFPLH